MLQQLDIGNKVVTVGDKCVITKNGAKNGFSPINVQLTIWGFRISPGETLIGLHSKIRNKNWASLDGNVETGHGLWISPSNFNSSVCLMSTKYRISKFNFKNEKLDHEQCKILHTCKDGNVFVELDKYISGGSCDGLGKTGHCILLPGTLLEKIKQKIGE